MRTIVLGLMPCCMAANAQVSINVTGTEDSVVVNDTFAVAHTDVALMNLQSGIEEAVKGDYHRAIGFLDAALLFDLDNPRIWYNRGLASYYLKDYDQAIADFTETLALRPSDTSALGQRGICYAMLGHHAEALADFDELLRVNPTSSVGHYNKGIAQLQLGDFEAACALLKRADELGYPDAVGVMGMYCE